MKIFKKSKTKFLAMFMLPLVLMCSGCVYLVVGGIGAVGGYIVSPDTVEGLTSNEVIDVWDTSIEILSIMGLILEEQDEAGVIYAKVSGAEVTVSILGLSDTTTKLQVKARKYYLPKISVAQDVFVKIMSELNE